MRRRLDDWLRSYLASVLPRPEPRTVTIVERHYLPEERENARHSPIAVVGWFVGCVAFTLGGFLAVEHGAQAFSDPSAQTYGDPGTIELGIERAPGEVVAGPTAVLTAQIRVVIVQNGFERLEVGFPQAAARRKFALILAGRAQIAFDGTTTVPRQSIGYQTCESAIPGRPDVSCQIIRGVVPPSRDDRVACDVADYCSGDPDVFIVGKRSGEQSTDDWAHETIRFPFLEPDSLDTVVRREEGVDLEGTYQFLGGPNHEEFGFDTAWEVVDAFPQPTIELQGLNWNDRYASPVVVLRRRDAQSTGNKYIAGGAASFALAIGLMPIALESSRSWRRFRRQSRR